MKKILTISLASFAILSAFVACQKDNDTTSESPVDSEKKQVTISVSIPEEGLETKVSLEQDGSDKKLIKLAWETGDEIDINGETFRIKDASISVDGHSAEFTGTDPGTGGPYTISYEVLPGSFTSQTQAADGSTDHLGYSVSLIDADTYENISFSSDWASAHGATLAQSSVLRLRALLPAAIASAVKKVIFKASENVFDGGKTLEVELKPTVGTNGSDNTLDIYATLPAGDVKLADDMDLLVQFQVSDNDYDKYTAYRSFVSGTDFIKSGNTQYLGINCSNIAFFANASTIGIGTLSNPYLIGDQHQMQAMHSEIPSEGETLYFKLIDDIDLTGIDWAPLITGKPYARYYNFDGNDKTISNLNTKNDVGYPSLFGIFNGIAKDLTIIDATINHTTSGTDVAGVFASYIGAGTLAISPNVSGIIIRDCAVGSDGTRITSYAGGLSGQVENDKVTISNIQVIDTNIFGPSTDVGAAGGIVGHVKAAPTIEKVAFVGGNIKSYRYVGGLIGAINITSGETASITKSSFSGTSTATYRYSGGLVGYNLSATGTININNCYEVGSVTASSGWAGGILGAHAGTSNINLENCYATGAVTAPWGAGGIVGQVSKDGLSVVRCMPFNSSISATNTDASEHYSSGAVIAYGKSVNVVVNYCYRISDMASRFNDCTTNSANVIEQQSFITSPGTIPQRQSLNYGYYHHGRNTNYGLTELVNYAAIHSASSKIGGDWDPSIWDLTGANDAYPTLR